MDRRGRSEREGGPGGGGESADSGDNRAVPEDPDSPNTGRSLLRASISEIRLVATAAQIISITDYVNYRGSFQSLPVNASASLSLSLDSQPPGPSGLNFHFPVLGPGSPPTTTTTTTSAVVPGGHGRAVSTSSSLSGAAGRDGERSGAGRGSGERSPFLVSPSQDLLASQASQNLFPDSHSGKDFFFKRVKKSCGKGKL